MSQAAAAGAAPRVTVVIPTWNGKDLLPIILDSLETQRFADRETVVVDNGSEDGTVDYMRSRWPAVHTIALATNGGFSAAINPGIHHARGDYVVLVNNDVELEPDWIATMVDFMDAHPAAASAVGKILDYTERDLFQEAGSDFAWDGTPRMRGNGERDRGQFDAPATVFSVCAGAAIYRRSAFDHIGAFDERFFAYLEDVDWGFRARLAGYEALYTPGASAFHVGSATTKKSNLPVSKLYARNNLYLIAKNYPRSALLRYLLAYSRPQLRLLARAVRRGWWRDLGRAYVEFAQLLPAARAERRRIKAFTRASAADLDLPTRHPR